MIIRRKLSFTALCREATEKATCRPVNDSDGPPVGRLSCQGRARGPPPGTVCHSSRQLMTSWRVLHCCWPPLRPRPRACARPTRWRPAHRRRRRTARLPPAAPMHCCGAAGMHTALRGRAARVPGCCSCPSPWPRPLVVPAPTNAAPRPAAAPAAARTVQQPCLESDTIHEAKWPVRGARGGRCGRGRPREAGMESGRPGKLTPPPFGAPPAHLDRLTPPTGASSIASSALGPPTGA